MSDPQPELWGPILRAAVRTILMDLMAGRTGRGPITRRAELEAGCAPRTVTNLLHELGRLGVVDRADRGKLRLTVLGRRWALEYLATTDAP